MSPLFGRGSQSWLVSISSIVPLTSLRMLRLFARQLDPDHWESSNLAAQMLRPLGLLVDWKQLEFLFLIFPRKNMFGFGLF